MDVIGGAFSSWWYRPLDPGPKWTSMTGVSARIPANIG